MDAFTKVGSKKSTRAITHGDNAVDATYVVQKLQTHNHITVATIAKLQLHIFTTNTSSITVQSLDCSTSNGIVSILIVSGSYCQIAHHCSDTVRSCD